VLDRFAAFLAGRGLSTASDQVCVDFIASQTGTRVGALREPVTDRDVKAVRRPVVLMADALAGRAVIIDQSVIPAKDGCPARFRALRDDYVASCRARGNAEATVAAKDKAVSRFLGYLDEMGAGDLAALGVRDVSGFLLRQRGLRRKTIAGMRSSLADFLTFLAAAGRAPQGLAGRLPPHRHLRHESEPHLWTAEEIRRLLAVIDRQSATGKRDYAMILMTARLGLRISDLRQLELGDLDWRARTLTIVQHKTGRPLSLPLGCRRRTGGPAGRWALPGRRWRYRPAAAVSCCAPAATPHRIRCRPPRWRKPGPAHAPTCPPRTRARRPRRPGEGPGR
jgi:integrase